MITAMNRIYVVPEYAEQLEQRFKTRAGLVDGMPGFIWNKVLRPVLFQDSAEHQSKCRQQVSRPGSASVGSGFWILERDD